MTTSEIILPQAYHPTHAFEVDSVSRPERRLGHMVSRIVRGWQNFQAFMEPSDAYVAQVRQLVAQESGLPESDGLIPDYTARVDQALARALNE